MDKVLYDIYENVDGDEIVKFDSGNGFSIVKKYKDSKYSDFVMLIRVELRSNKFLSGDIAITKPDYENGVKIFKTLSTEEIPTRITNYNFRKEFEYIDGKFYNIGNSLKPLTLNQVIDVLIYNHLNGISRVKKFLHNFYYTSLLYFSYFMIDKQYSRENAIKEMVDRWIDLQKNQNKIFQVDVSGPEPFLKYFKIYKNQLLTFLFLSGLIILFSNYCSIRGFNINNSPDITNSLVVIISFISLYLLEKNSLFFSSLFQASNNKRSRVDNWIHKIDNFTFDLKIK